MHNQDTKIDSQCFQMKDNITIKRYSSSKLSFKNK